MFSSRPGSFAASSPIGMRLVRAEARDCALGSGPAAVPGLEQRVARLHEEREAALREHRERLGLLEARQVPEVGVLAEGVLRVVRAGARCAPWDERDAFAELALEAATPLGELGARNRIKALHGTSRHGRARGYQGGAATSPFEIVALRVRLACA